MNNPIIQSMRMFKKQSYLRFGFVFWGYVTWQRTKREMRTKTKMKMERRRIRKAGRSRHMLLFSSFHFCPWMMSHCPLKRSLFLGEFFAEFLAIYKSLGRGSAGAKWHRSCSPMRSPHPVSAEVQDKKEEDDKSEESESEEAVLLLFSAIKFQMMDVFQSHHWRLKADRSKRHQMIYCRSGRHKLEVVKRTTLFTSAVVEVVSEKMGRKRMVRTVRKTAKRIAKKIVRKRVERLDFRSYTGCTGCWVWLWLHQINI